MKNFLEMANNGTQSMDDFIEENWFQFIGTVYDKDAINTFLNYKKDDEKVVKNHFIEPKTNSFLINSLVKNKIRDNSNMFLKALHGTELNPINSIGKKVKNLKAVNVDLKVDPRSRIPFVFSSLLNGVEEVMNIIPFDAKIKFYGKDVRAQKFIGKKCLTRKIKRYEAGLRDPYRSEVEMINEGLDQFQDQIEQEKEDWNEMMMATFYQDDFFDSIDYDMMDPDEEWNYSYA